MCLFYFIYFFFCVSNKVNEPFYARCGNFWFSPSTAAIFFQRFFAAFAKFRFEYYLFGAVVSVRVQ